MSAAAVLMPIEFKECLTDSPEFRRRLHVHEKELDKTSQAIKALTKEIKSLVDAARNFSIAQKNLMCRLRSFAQDQTKATMTEDEVVISQSFVALANIIKMVEEERQRMLDLAEARIVGPLEAFRKDAIGGAKERRKKFEKQTQKFYQSQERHLNLSTKKDDQFLQEADASLDMEQRHFVQASMEYVFLLQEVHERKKYEFVEIILSHTYSWLEFYHQGHEIYNDHKSYMTDLQQRIQRTRENFNATRQEAVLLKNKMLEIQDPGSMNKMFTRQGYLFLMERKAFVTTWTKYYCYYKKETREFRMTSYSESDKLKQIHPKMEMTLKSCVRRASDSIDKRFCLDLTVQMHERCPSAPSTAAAAAVSALSASVASAASSAASASNAHQLQTLTLQTLSEEDCKRWMDAMDGKEPIYAHPIGIGVAGKEETALDESGLTFISRAIAILESKGLEDQGLYRVVGVSSKVSKLLSLGLDPARWERVSLEDAAHWEVKTITSAIKQYFRNLPEPLMTYKLHCDFIAAAKKEKPLDRLASIHFLIYQLPKTNFHVLKTLMQHLCNVTRKSDHNLMPVSNLGVCFGPTLLRPEEESVAAILDIKFCNIVVEILIEHFEKIFNSTPMGSYELLDGSTFKCSQGSSSPPKPSNASSSSSTSSQASGVPPPPSQVTHNTTKANQPVLQTVVTSFTTSEPQTVHFGQSSQNTPPLPPRYASLLRSEATSNLKGGGGPITSAVSRGQPTGVPPWQAHGSAISASTSSLNTAHTGMASDVSMNSLTTMGSSYDSSMAHTSSASNINITNNNNNNMLNRPPRSSTTAPNGRAGGAAPLTFINPISNRDCSSSSSCESLSSRGSRDVSLQPSTASISSPSPQPTARSRPPPQLPHGATFYHTTHNGDNGRAPHHHSHLTSIGSSNNTRLTPAYPPTFRQHMETKRVRTLYACVGENETELSFEPNQILTNVCDSKEPGWLTCSLNGRSGLVPQNYVELIDDNGSLPSLVSQRNTDV